MKPLDMMYMYSSPVALQLHLLNDVKNLRAVSSPHKVIPRLAFMC